MAFFCQGSRDGSVRNRTCFDMEKRLPGKEAGEEEQRRSRGRNKWKEQKEIGPSTLENARKRNSGHFGIPGPGFEEQQGIYISVAPSHVRSSEENGTSDPAAWCVRRRCVTRIFAVLTGDLSIYGTYAREILKNAAFHTLWTKSIPC